jgi:hypothetical protein
MFKRGEKSNFKEDGWNIDVRIYWCYLYIYMFLMLLYIKILYHNWKISTSYYHINFISKYHHIFPTIIQYIPWKYIENHIINILL